MRKVRRCFFLRKEKRYVCCVDPNCWGGVFSYVCIFLFNNSVVSKTICCTSSINGRFYSQSTSASSLVFNIDFSPSCLFITQSINIVFLLDRLTTAGKFGVFLLQFALKSHLLVTFSRLTFNRILNFLPYLWSQRSAFQQTLIQPRTAQVTFLDPTKRYRNDHTQDINRRSQAIFNAFLLEDICGLSTCTIGNEWRHWYSWALLTSKLLNKMNINFQRKLLTILCTTLREYCVIFFQYFLLLLQSFLVQ